MNKDVKETIIANIPGNIVAIEVKVGQTVQPNDLILTMEAMKMLNEITCTEGGTVIDILVSEGNFVNTDEVMVLIA